MENQSREDEIRAKQAISPAGLSDRSAEGTSGPSAEMDAPELETDELEDKYMDGDEVSGDIHMMHPNRGYNKPDLDKPAYSW